MWALHLTSHYLIADIVGTAVMLISYGFLILFLLAVLVLDPLALIRAPTEKYAAEKTHYLACTLLLRVWAILILADVVILAFKSGTKIWSDSFPLSFWALSFFLILVVGKGGQVLSGSTKAVAATTIAYIIATSAYTCLLIGSLYSSSSVSKFLWDIAQWVLALLGTFIFLLVGTLHVIRAVLSRPTSRRYRSQS